MSKHTDTSRRSFFLKGGAALGAGLASAGAGAASLLDDSSSRIRALHARLATLEDREALRLLQQSFVTLLEQQAYESLPELFSQQASLRIPGGEAQGRKAIAAVFAGTYRRREAESMLKTVSGDSTRRQDSILIAADARRASACFDARSELCRPLRGSSTLQEMARLQGHSETSEWQNARFELQFIKEQEHWLISSLEYRQV